MSEISNSPTAAKTAVRIEQLTDSIYRIRRSVSFGETLTERYGLINPPKPVCELPAVQRAIRLKSGRFLCFELRPDEDNERWAGIAAYFEERFKAHAASYKTIQGNPNNVRSEPASQASGGAEHFGIDFRLSETERFYGLGEASKTRLELRGSAYQNWTVYQYDEIPIPFLVSSEGWGLLINAAYRHFVDIGEQFSDRLIISGEQDELDIFIFDGESMQDVISMYLSLTGRPMLLPKWAYGLTYIAPIAADQFEVIAEAERFRNEHIPCDHISLEPGWMKKFYDFSTKKEWNLDKFHVPSWQKSRDNPQHLLGALRRMGMHLSLWVCTDYDLTDEEERRIAGAEKGTFEAWYTHLGEFVKYGVDGFKLDPACMVDTMRPDMICANGISQPRMHNINQTLLPKQMYKGFSEQLGLRPMHHYCGGYMGIQKWSASTTGDNGGQLGAMVWLLTLAMSGHMNTTVDMHIFEPASIHFGMFVPWAHLNAWSGIRQPWYTNERLHAMFGDYARMRYAMIPYIYSTAIEGHETGVPMIRPLPLAFPDFAEGYECIYQYMLGPWVMISAFTDSVALPEGEWIDYFTGERYDGGRVIDYTPPENRGGGMFIRSGAIIPMWRERQSITGSDETEIFIDLFPSDEPGFTALYTFREDDGLTCEYETIPSCRTEITCTTADDGSLEVHIGERVGDYRGKPEVRRWLVRIHGQRRGVSVKCNEPSARVSYVFTDCLG